MLFSFTEEQRELHELVHGFLGQRFPATQLRQQWETGSTANVDIASPLADLGVLAITISEDHGGLGLSNIDMALSLEEFGYFGVSETIAFTAAVVAPFLSAYASTEVQSKWLPQIASGEALFTIKTLGQDVVLGASAVRLMLVEAKDGIHLVEYSPEETESITTMDRSLNAAAYVFESNESTLLTGDREAVQYFQALVRASVGSVLIGVSQRLLDMTNDYITTREQFGRPIGSFQAIKHRMADTAVAIEAARSLAWYAQYSLAHRSADVEIAAAMAKSAANRASNIANYASLQHHGGVGFTWEFDVHMWLQRSFALERMFGSTAELETELGETYIAQSV